MTAAASAPAIVDTMTPETAEKIGADNNRVFNFSAGPCQLPVEVLEECKQDLLNYKGSGMSVMEMSHRSKEFISIMSEAEKDLREILQVPDNYKIMYLQGGATLQFSAVVFNLMGGDNAKTKADYAQTGQWGEKAQKECKKLGMTPNLVCDSKPGKFTSVPAVSDWKLGNPDETAFLHYCANETVNGVSFNDPNWMDALPADYLAKVPIVADMSSEFLSRPVNVAKHGVIYAGAQKNIGPAGNCVVIVREDLLGALEHQMCPSYCSWKGASDAASMHNTPACFSVYVTGVYLKYTKRKGGLTHWSAMADTKSGMIYDIIDGSDDFYTNPINKPDRSRVNVPFVIKGGNEELEKKFLDEAKQLQLYTLAGHRSVGGIRASLYNGMPQKGVEKLADFMKAFAQANAA